MSLDLSWITRYLLRQAEGTRRGNRDAEKVAPIVNAIAPAFIPQRVQDILGALDQPGGAGGVAGLVTQGIGLLPNMNADQKQHLSDFVGDFLAHGHSAKDMPAVLLDAFRTPLKNAVKAYVDALHIDTPLEAAKVEMLKLAHHAADDIIGHLPQLSGVLTAFENEAAAYISSIAVAGVTSEAKALVIAWAGAFLDGVKI